MTALLEKQLTDAFRSDDAKAVECVLDAMLAAKVNWKICPMLIAFMSTHFGRDFQDALADQGLTGPVIERISEPGCS